MYVMGVAMALGAAAWVGVAILAYSIIRTSISFVIRRVQPAIAGRRAIV